MRARFAAGVGFGLVAGFGAGIVFTVIIFLAWFNELSQALVGVGTLVVAIVALYVSRLGSEERHKRDLTQRVYSPLRAEIVKWLDPEHQTFHVWNELREKELYWTERVPRDMKDMLEKAGRAFERLLEARLALNTLTFEETARVGNKFREKMGLPIPDGMNPPTVHVRTGYQDAGFVYPTNLWISRKNLSDYIQSLVDRNYPNMDWTVVFLLDGKPQGGLPEVHEYMDRMMDFYEGTPQAKELRKSSGEMKALSSKLLLRIDEEVG